MLEIGFSPVRNSLRNGAVDWLRDQPSLWIQYYLSLCLDRPQSPLCLGFLVCRMGTEWHTWSASWRLTRHRQTAFMKPPMQIDWIVSFEAQGTCVCCSDPTQVQNNLVHSWLFATVSAPWKPLRRKGLRVAEHGDELFWEYSEPLTFQRCSLSWGWRRETSQSLQAPLPC